MRSWFTFPLLLALVSPCLQNCGPAAKTKPPNVVVIVLDTVRPDYLSAYDHPSPTSPYLESFAQSGTRYDRAWSTSSWTLPAHASLFSGTLPAYHRATQTTERIAPDVPLLAQRLQQAGYQTVGLSSNMWISKATGLDRGFEYFRDDWSFLARMRSMGAGHPCVTTLKEWFERGRKPDKPFFAFVNLSEAHMPYLPHWEEAAPFFASKSAWEQAITELFPDQGLGLMIREYTGKALDERELVELRALYEGAVRRVDSITQALMDVVDHNSDPRETLVFVVSDHGENLGEHGQLSHVFNLYDTNLRIALLARGPGIEAGSVDERHVQITDLYPTILHAAGLEPETSCVGFDLRDKIPGERMLLASLDRPVISIATFPKEIQESGVLARFDHPLMAAVGSVFKEIRGGAAGSQVFDLGQDPGELDPLESLPPEAIEHLKKMLAGQVELEKERASAEVRGNARQDPATRKGLHDLG